MEKQPAVYILASRRNGTLYVGVTSGLAGRTWQHRTHQARGFTTSYNVGMLVWYEMHETMESAILREKRIKKWRRSWKIELIETMNPYWNDLWNTLFEEQKTLGPRLRGDDGFVRFGGDDGTSVSA